MHTRAAWGSSITALLALCATAIVALLLAGGAGAAAQHVNLDQCSNGPIDAGSSCPPGWQNGDLNPQNSTYREGDSVPFRAILSGLSAGVHTMLVQYDTTQQTKHAYDYLTSYDRTVSGVDACDGVASCSGPGTTFGPIPVSDNPTVPAVGVVPDAQRYFTIWNGTVTDVALGGASDVSGEQQSLTVTFTAASDTVVIAWGGHVADEVTWPHATAAGAINGSPYHMRVLSLDGDSTGHQDRSMKTDLTSPSLVTDVASGDSFAGAIPAGGSVSDNATLSGDNGPVSGTVSFFACFAASGTPDCTSGGDLVAAGVAVSALGTATSGAFSPQSAGTYCFRAVFTPDAAAPYALTAETNAIIQSNGNHGECFTVANETELLSSSVATEIHDASGIVDSALVGSSVHDVAIVSGSGEGATPTGSVTFARFNGTGCSGEPATTQTVALTDGTASSDDANVAEGGLSYRVSYGGDNIYAISDGICENLSSTLPTPPPPPPGSPGQTSSPTPPSTPSTPSTPATPPAPPTIDLAITKVGTPASSTVGNRVTWTEVVTNNGPSGATGVTVADSLPAGMTFVSAAASQGSCAGGPVVSCALGALANGGSATVTIVTIAANAGTITNTATVVGKEAETNAANNTASAKVIVKGPFVPPVARPTFCTAVVVSPRSIFVGRKSLLTMHLTQNGKAIAGIRVRIKGSALALLTGASTKKGVVNVPVLPKRAGIVSFVPVAHKACKTPRIGVVGVFTPPVTG